MTTSTKAPQLSTALALTAAFLAATVASAAERPTKEVGMFGNTPSRNMAAEATGLPTTWDPETGLNVLWSQPLGSQSYGGPVAANGRVVVGSNNESLRNPKLEGDRGNVMVFDAKTGEFLWQSAHPKHPAGRVNDWPLQGVCSTPYIDGDRIYYVSNRAEVICADLEGFHDGENDGPVTTETEKSVIDEDVIWKLDMMGELGVFPHNLAAGNPLLVDGILYTTTGQGVDEGHINIPKPDSPSFLAIDAKTGKVVWQSNLPAERILHGTWSNPAFGTMGGKQQVVFAGGDGWIYSFEPKTGKLIWKFDANPKDSVWELGGSGTRNNIISTPVIHGDVVYVGVGQDPEHGEAPGHLWAIKGTLEGDVTASAVVWHFGPEVYNRTISTVAIAGDILYAADLSGYLYALELATGKELWRYECFAAIWGSPFAADGKVYLGDEDGDVVVLAQGREKKVLAEINMGNSVYTTPIVYDGVLYISTRSKLFALKDGIPAKGASEAAE